MLRKDCKSHTIWPMIYVVIIFILSQINQLLWCFYTISERCVISWYTFIYYDTRAKVNGFCCIVFIKVTVLTIAFANPLPIPRVWKAFSTVGLKVLRGARLNRLKHGWNGYKPRASDDIGACEHARAHSRAFCDMACHNTLSF